MFNKKKSIRKENKLQEMKEAIGKSKILLSDFKQKRKKPIIQRKKQRNYDKLHFE